MKKILSFITFITLGFCSLGADIVWTGDGDGEDWNDGDNWDSDIEPTSADNVFITGSGRGATEVFFYSDSHVTIANLTIDGNVDLYIDFSTLEVTNNIELLDVSSDIIISTFDGNIGNLTIGGNLTNLTGSVSILNSNCTIEYNGSVEQEIIDLNYENLIFSGTGKKVIPVTPSVGGTFTPGTSEVEYTSDDTQSILDGAYTDLTFSGAGEKQISGTITTSGTFTPGTAKVTYNGDSQTIMNGNYGTIALDGTGTHIINGNITGDALSNSGSIVEYNGTTTQNIVQGTYNQLVLSGIGQKDISNGTVVVQNDFNANNTLIVISNIGQLVLEGSSSQVDFGTSTVSYAGDNQVIPTYSSNYYDLNIDGTGTKTLADENITINNLSISTGGLLLIDEETLYIQGDFTNDGTFTKGEGSVVFTGSNSSEINGSSSTNFKNLTIAKDADTDLTINSTVNICPKGTLTLTSGNDDVVIGTGNLILKSDETGFARVAELLNGSSITGDVTVEAYINSATRRWWQLTNSVANPAASEWIDDIFVTGDFTGNSNAFLSGVDNTSMYTYNEAHVDAPIDSGWAAFPASSDGESMPVGTGFRIFIRDDLSAASPKTLSVTGTLNQGEINIPMTYTDKDSDADDGWNLLGNPYASSIDGSAIKTANEDGLNDENIYVWESSMRDWLISPSTIAPHQAFFIQSNGDNSTFDIDESMKTEGGALVRQASLGNEIHISIFDENENETFNYAETSIFVNANATSEFDKPYESSYLSRNMFNSDNTENIVDIATRLESGKRLSANHIPESSEIQQIPLYLEYSSAKKYTLQVSLKDYEYGEQIVLIDNYTNEETLLDDEITKQIELTDEASRASDRFELQISAEPVGLDNEFNSNISIYPNPANNIVNLTVLSAYSDIEISISDLSGNIVYTESINNSASSFSKEITTENLESGVYFISVTSNGSTHSEKLAINK